MSKIKQITNKIIEWSEENTAGTIMSAENIYLVVRNTYRHSLYISKPVIDQIISNNESESGYLVKATDFISAFKNY